MPPSGDELDPAHLGPEAVERYLRRHWLAARKSLSQNHLADGAVLEHILEVAAIRPGERIVEVGPGIGILTAQLLAAGAVVTAVELDARLAGHLRARFSDEPNLTLLEADFLDVELASVASDPWALVANVPYHISSPILHHVLGTEPRPRRFVMMVQKEVAERIAAPAGGMSYLSVFVQYHAQVRVAFSVPAAAFEPAPEVDSAVLVGETRHVASSRLPRTSCGAWCRRASASAARWSTTCSLASSPGSSVDASIVRWQPAPSTLTVARRRSRSTSGWHCARP